MPIELFVKDLSTEFKEYVACGVCEIVPSSLPDIYNLHLTWADGLYSIGIEDLKNKLFAISITKFVLPDLPEHQDKLSLALASRASEKEVGKLYVEDTANGLNAVIRAFKALPR